AFAGSLDQLWPGQFPGGCQQDFSPPQVATAEVILPTEAKTQRSLQGIFDILTDARGIKHGQPAETGQADAWSAMAPGGYKPCMFLCPQIGPVSGSGCKEAIFIGKGLTGSISIGSIAGGCEESQEGVD